MTWLMLVLIVELDCLQSAELYRFMYPFDESRLPAMCVRVGALEVRELELSSSDWPL
jgi:hypothetical protein